MILDNEESLGVLHVTTDKQGTVQLRDLVKHGFEELVGSKDMHLEWYVTRLRLS